MDKKIWVNTYLPGAKNLCSQYIIDAKLIDPDAAVLVLCHQGCKSGFQALNFNWTKMTLEDTVLNSCTKVLEGFHHLQPSLIIADIVGDYNELFYLFLLYHLSD